MKAHQRKIYRKLEAALKKARKQGYLSTTGAIYRSSSLGLKEDGIKGFACAYGAMCIGLGVDPSNDDFYATQDAVADALGVDRTCVENIYFPIWNGNDNNNGIFDNNKSNDARALESLKSFLEDNPWVC